jgi:hypothetical protein
MSFALLDTESGLALTLHRLALAVTPEDAVTGGPAGPGLRVGRETVRSVDDALRAGRAGDHVDPTEPLGGPYDVGFVLRHRTTESATAVVRIDDRRRRYVPRRIEIALWTLADVEASDTLVDPGTRAVTPPHGPFVPSTSRRTAPWLLPGPAYPAPATCTGVRTRIVRNGEPVRWARVEAFTGAGRRIGWAHGDEHGDVLLLALQSATFPAPGTTATMPLALRVHHPDPTAPADPAVEALLAAGDGLADLPVEPLARTPISPPPGLPADEVTGLRRPVGYVTAPDQVVVVDVGRVTRVDALQMP